MGAAGPLGMELLLLLPVFPSLALADIPRATVGCFRFPQAGNPASPITETCALEGPRPPPPHWHSPSSQGPGGTAVGKWPSASRRSTNSEPLGLGVWKVSAETESKHCGY